MQLLKRIPQKLRAILQRLSIKNMTMLRAKGKAEKIAKSVLAKKGASVVSPKSKPEKLDEKNKQDFSGRSV